MTAPSTTPPGDGPAGADGAGPDGAAADAAAGAAAAPTGGDAPGPGGASAAPDEPAAENRFVLWLRGLDLPRRPGWIGGVCAGVADRLGIDPLIVRGIVLVVAVLGGPALLLYAAGWLLLPDQDGALPVERLLRGRLDRVHAGIGVLLLASMLPVAQGFWSLGSAYTGVDAWAPTTGRALWSAVVLGLIAGFVVWIVRRSRRRGEERAPAAAETAAHQGPLAPPAPQDRRPSSPEAVAEWRERQEAWRAEREAFRAQQTPRPARPLGPGPRRRSVPPARSPRPGSSGSACAGQRTPGCGRASCCSPWVPRRWPALWPR
ncbi:PspC domain-containing protein [Rathayibacter tanaceti]|uniref:PspC domain protein n=1 Tax=Rathayibacter tanaceti TaxID=1671680 RepID=A0A162F6W4_9MICO|nr:PspC domain-containing protein [Rathayibacter tanaceti]KZX19813.1 PspC domain protein [Rathayibacter tanaceti]